MKNIWKTIEGYENYMVSNMGEVKSFYKSNEGVNLKPTLRGSYYSVALTNNTGLKRFSVHRLVAQAFIPNINDEPYINHKNGDKLDNRAFNLEWCTAKHNTNHYYYTLKKNELLKNQPVCQYNLNGELVKKWDSVVCASNDLDICVDDIIHSCNRRKKHLTTKGFIWRFENDIDTTIQYQCYKKVIQLNKYGEQICEYFSITEASKKNCIQKATIKRSCEQQTFYKGYYWMYKGSNDYDKYFYYKNNTFIKCSQNNVIIDVFYGIKDLVDKTGISFVKIINACKNKTWCEGFKWCIKEEDNTCREQKRRKSVVCFSKDMMYIKEYDSLTKAAKEVGVQTTHISTCCRDLSKTAGSFRWMYKDEYDEYLKENKK